MRVLFYSSIFPRPGNNTRGIFCFHACRAMVQLGHEVRVVSPRGWLEHADSGTSLPGLSELNVTYPLYVYPPRILQSASDRFMAFTSRRTMVRTIRELRPDCILSYWAHPDGAVAAGFARAAGIPSGIIVGGSDVLVLARNPGPRRRSVVRALHATDAVITVGRQLADAVEALGIPPTKVHVVSQGVDDSLFSPGFAAEARKRLGISETGRILVSVGRLVPVKGVDVLLQAMSRLVSRQHDVSLYLVGDGPSRGELKALAARLRINNVVRFVGEVQQAELPDWYRAANLTVLASRSEGVPNVLRESLACGTPFVATRVGGVSEIAEGTTNRLVASEDPEALAEAMARSLADPPVSVPTIRYLTWRESTQQVLDVVLRSKGGVASE